MPAEPELDIEAILRALAGHGVDFIVVGGVCAVLHGAPVATFDLDALVATLTRVFGEMQSHPQLISAYMAPFC